MPVPTLAELGLAASMGPQLVSCGCAILVWMKIAPSCFNGAAARELRMRQLLTAQLTVWVRLQWGRSS